MLPMLKIAICDDQEEDRALLCHFLEAFFSALNYSYKITEYRDGESLIADYEENFADYSLVLLDIFMGKMNGIEVATEIRKYDEQLPLIFLTGTSDYAVESYDVRAFGYLIKPLSQSKATSLLERFLRESETNTQASLFIREGTRGYRIPYRDIVVIESRRNLLLVRSVDKQEHRLYAKLNDVEQTLQSNGFLRCHQSFLINMAQVESVSEIFTMKTGEQVPIRRRNLKELRELYFKHICC